jgi:ornithine decarboxylase
LYLNDGSYGALYDSVHEKWSYPVRAVLSSGVIYTPPAATTTSINDKSISSDKSDSANSSCTGNGSAPHLVPYTIYGPTCDSADKFPEPVLLPAGLQEGDYLEWGNIGAYGRCMATAFNGFGCLSYVTVTVPDSPWPSLYGASRVVGGHEEQEEEEAPGDVDVQ